MTTDIRRRHLLQQLQVGAHQLRPERAVHADRQQPTMGNRVPERLDFLAGNERRAAFVERAGYHHRYAATMLIEVALDRKQAGLQVQRVDDGLGQQDVDARLQ